MRLIAGPAVAQDFQRLIVQIKPAKLFGCAVALRWQAEKPAPWIADNALPRVLELHLTKALASEHAKTTLVLFASGDILLVGDAIGNAAYHRVQVALEDEAALLGARPDAFTMQAFDLSVDWDAFMTLCKDLNGREEHLRQAMPAPAGSPTAGAGSAAAPANVPALHALLTAATARLAQRGVPANRRLNLLFVEDEPSIRNLLKTLLADSGHALAFAATGREAVEAYAHTPPHMVFLDINLPDISGLDVLEILRQHDPAAYAVMLTSSARSQEVQQAVKLGARHYIVKPFSRHKLQECLTRFWG